ncbi:hypothetical protein NDU88_006952 [Pleurodeles waltl]|uniref:Uncharacterized protein n=1 Tax=Pleurodeles waltl TaxID=8319 RepID=A0AAV7MEP2_PLEWA|nr:hypothetical protein NDU88_006952 [Pleurodeles waltl]
MSSSLLGRRIAAPQSVKAPKMAASDCGILFRAIFRDGSVAWLKLVPGMGQNVWGGCLSSVVSFADGFGTSEPEDHGPQSFESPKMAASDYADVRLSNFFLFLGGAFFRPAAVLNLNWSQVWDKSSGRTAGVRWVPGRGEGAARAGALRRGTRLSRAVFGRTRPALRTPGSPPRANDQPRRAWRGHSGELLPLWQRRGLSGSSGSPSMQLRSAGPRGL